MEMIPQLPPHQGNRVRKGGARFTIPRRAAHAGRSLLDQQLGRGMRQIGRQQCLGFEALLRVSDQDPADGDRGFPRGYHTVVSVATSTCRGSSPYHCSTSNEVHWVFSSANTASSVGRRLPVSRGRPLVPGAREGGGS